MLVDYSERGFELLHRPLASAEREELYDVFRRVGEALAVEQLPLDHASWREDRARHLERDLVVGPYTAELRAAYRRALGAARYALLRRVQSMLAPGAVLAWTGERPSPLARSAVRGYRLVRRSAAARRMLHRALVPRPYVARVSALDE